LSASPPQSEISETSEAAGEAPGEESFVYRLEIPFPENQALDLAARFTALKPALEPLAAGAGLELFLEAGPDGRVRGFGADEDVFGFFKGQLASFPRRKDPVPELRLAWLPGGLPESFRLGGYSGPVRLIAEGSGEEAGPLFGPALAVPGWFRSSPVRQAECSLLLSALRDFLNPHLGAPETKGQKILIISEGPPLAPLAARKMGSGEVLFAFSERGTGVMLDALLEANPGADGVRPLEMSLSALAARFQEKFREGFSLIAASCSPYLANRRLKTLASWLRGQGLLVLPAVSGSQLTALTQKAASRSGLSLLHSVCEGDGVMLTFQKPRPRSAAIWDWRPGSWQTELTEEDKLLLERIAGSREAEEGAGLGDSQDLSAGLADDSEEPGEDGELFAEPDPEFCDEGDEPADDAEGLESGGGSLEPEEDAEDWESEDGSPKPEEDPEDLESEDESPEPEADAEGAEDLESGGGSPEPEDDAEDLEREDGNQEPDADAGDSESGVRSPEDAEDLESGGGIQEPEKDSEDLESEDESPDPEAESHLADFEDSSPSAKEAPSGEPAPLAAAAGEAQESEEAAGFGAAEEAAANPPCEETLGAAPPNDDDGEGEGAGGEEPNPKSAKNPNSGGGQN
jgi:hypothetical protein